MKNILKVLIALLLLAVAASAVVLFVLRGQDGEQESPPPSSAYSEKDFRPDKYAGGRVKYDEIMALDLEGNYPGTPQMVADQYSKIYTFVYGDFIANENMLTEMVDLQRKFYSAEILEANTAEEQYENLLVQLNDAKAAGYSFIGYETQNVVYDEQIAALCRAEVLQYSSTGRNVLVTYLMEKDPDSKKWLIQSWEFRVLDSGLTEE